MSATCRILDLPPLTSQSYVRLAIILVLCCVRDLTCTSLQLCTFLRDKSLTLNKLMLHFFFMHIVMYFYQRYMCGFSVPPDPPNIQSDVRQIRREGQEVTLTCTSTGGVPRPTVVWLKNGHEIASGPVVLSQTGVVSAKTFTVDHTDHLANYSCLVYNSENIKSPYIAYHLLHVLCKESLIRKQLVCHLLYHNCFT